MLMDSTYQNEIYNFYKKVKETKTIKYYNIEDFSIKIDEYRLRFTINPTKLYKHVL